jgi:hypothetical protein
MTRQDKPCTLLSQTNLLIDIIENKQKSMGFYKNLEKTESLVSNNSIHIPFFCRSIVTAINETPLFVRWLLPKYVVIIAKCAQKHCAAFHLPQTKYLKEWYYGGGKKYVECRYIKEKSRHKLRKSCAHFPQ